MRKYLQLYSLVRTDLEEDENASTEVNGMNPDDGNYLKDSNYQPANVFGSQVSIMI